jgi:hypothetical protein
MLSLLAKLIQVPDHPFERRARATHREPTSSASPLSARLGSISGAVFASCLGWSWPKAFALGKASDRAKAKREYFRIGFNSYPLSEQIDRLFWQYFNQLHSAGETDSGLLCPIPDFRKVIKLNSFVPLGMGTIVGFGHQ